MAAREQQVQQQASKHGQLEQLLSALWQHLQELPRAPEVSQQQALSHNNMRKDIRIATIFELEHVHDDVFASSKKPGHVLVRTFNVCCCGGTQAMPVP